MPGCVAGRRQSRQLTRDAALPLHQLHQAELSQRPDTRGGVGKALGLDVRLMAHVPVRGAHPVASIRKGRHVLLTLRQQVPPDVIAVQMGHHHRVDVLWPHSIGLEVMQKLAPRRVRRVGWLGTETRIDEDRPPVGPYQVRAEIEANLVRLREVGLVRAPVVVRDGREEVT